jgi:hypothetical protein
MMILLFYIKLSNTLGVLNLKKKINFKKECKELQS